MVGALIGPDKIVIKRIEEDSGVIHVRIEKAHTVGPRRRVPAGSSCVALGCAGRRLR